MEMNCIDCGQPTRGGLRCRKDNGALIAAAALRSTRAGDEDLLREFAAGLTVARLAARLGVSRVAANNRLRRARRRAALRAG